MLDQIIKGCAVTMHNAALLTQEKPNLRAANEKKRQKRNRSTRQIPCKGGLSVEEGLQLAQQLNGLVKGEEVVSHAQAELSIQPDQPATRAPPRCNGCREIDHRTNSCKNRHI
jgi:hypothetical protein